MATAQIKKVELGILMDGHGIMFEQCSFGQSFKHSRLANPIHLIRNHSDNSIRQIISSNPHIRAILLSGGDLDLLDQQSLPIQVLNRIKDILSLIYELGVLPFYLPVLPRKNYRLELQGRVLENRSPRMFNMLGAWFREQIAEFGKTKLKYNPVIPIPFDIHLEKDGVYLSYKSYQNIALMAGVLIDLTLNLPPDWRHSAYKKALNYYHSQRQNKRNWRDGVWLGARFDPCNPKEKND